MENAMMQTASRVIRSAHTRWHRLVRDEAGSTLALLAVLPVLAGAVAIGVETGQLYRVKRQMQSSADAAALAGAVDRIAGKTNTVIAATAQYEAQRNGFTNGSSNVTVTVNAPPTSGAQINTTGAVEVIITKTMGFSLGALLVNMAGGTSATFDMRARSVAAQGTFSSTSSTTSYEGCMVALTTANEQGVNFTSFNNFTSDCTIMSNGGATGSGSSASINISGFNSATIANVWTRGSYSVSAYNSVTPTPSNALTNRSDYAVDPYASLGAPTLPAGGCTYTNYSAPAGSSITLTPGVYCGGLTVTNNNNVYFRKGTYYIANGDLVIQSDNNVSCIDCAASGGKTTGTTFVLTQTTGNNADIGGVSITSQNNVSLNAPSDDDTNPYKGVLFYQDSRATAGTMTSSSKIFTVASLNNATLSGAIYFPKNRIDISSVNNFGGNASTGCTIWVGRYIKFSAFNNNYKGGCATYGTQPVGIQTTTATTVLKGKVFE
jgi:Flp pilus assembly protein TadG